MSHCGNNGLRIVRTYSDAGAPTGESERWVTEDGRHWMRAPDYIANVDSMVTGYERRRVVGDRMRP